MPSKSSVEVLYTRSSLSDVARNAFKLPNIRCRSPPRSMFSRMTNATWAPAKRGVGATDAAAPELPEATERRNRVYTLHARSCGSPNSRKESTAIV